MIYTKRESLKSYICRETQKLLSRQTP